MKKIVMVLAALISTSVFADELDVNNPLVAYIQSNITEQAAHYFQENQKTLTDVVKKFAVSNETVSAVTPSSFRKLKKALRASGEIQTSQDPTISQQIEYLVSDTLTSKYVTSKEYVKGLKDYPKDQSAAAMNFMIGYVNSDYFKDDTTNFNPEYQDAYVKFLKKLIVKINQN